MQETAISIIKIEREGKPAVTVTTTFMVTSDYMKTLRDHIERVESK
jgi:hypothetical protein